MAKLSINIDEDKLATFVEFLRTIPYISIEESQPTHKSFIPTELNEKTPKGEEINPSEIDELNDELGDLFG